MKNRITTQGLHHVTLTVKDPQRSREFYTNILGFRVEAEFNQGPLLTNGTMWLVLFPAPDAPIQGDQFDESRIGLQELALGIESLKALQEAERILDEHRVPHGLIEDYGPELGLYAISFRDPDNIKLQLIAPYDEPGRR